MSGQRRRVWTRTTLEEGAQGFAVALDGRRVNTPGKAPLLLPTRPLAEAVRAEWDAQREVVDPTSMPLTRAANSAIDKVAPQYQQVVQAVAAYGDADLLCYRAEAPNALAERQAQAWDPWIDWAQHELAAPLTVCAGVMHHPQPPESLATLSRHVSDYDAFALTGLYDLVTLSGSLVLGLAVAQGAATTEDAWAAARIDEAWQEEQWGVDAEAAEAQAARRTQFDHAVHWLDLLR